MSINPFALPATESVAEAPVPVPAPVAPTPPAASAPQPPQPAPPRDELLDVGAAVAGEDGTVHVEPSPAALDVADIETMWRQYEVLARQIKKLEAEKKAIGAVLVNALGSHAVELPDGKVVETTRKRSLDAEALEAKFPSANKKNLHLYRLVLRTSAELKKILGDDYAGCTKLGAPELPRVS